MQATVNDIRRGDRFTWNGGKYIALDDARPWEEPGSSEDPLHQFAWVTAVKDVGQKPGADGVIDFDVPKGGMSQDLWQHAEIEIGERGLKVTWFGQQDKATSPEQARRLLRNITSARRKALRVIDDIDERRDQWIRGAILSEVPVIEIAEITGLSRARIYQIRDGHR